MGFWDGSGSALIGSLISGVVAVGAVFLTRHSERTDQREQASLSAAAECLELLQEMTAHSDTFIVPESGGSDFDWSGWPVPTKAVGDFIVECYPWARRIFAFSILVRPERLSYQLAVLWEHLQDYYPELLRRTVLEPNDPKALDTLARNFGTEIVNLQDELQSYLRSDWTKKRWPSIKIGSVRFSLQRPFIRKAGLAAAFERAKREVEQGGPKADY